ncbi:MAG: hypothetical protein WCA20_03970, partial [Candidatus Sulfotelmatobacter sp.]
MKLLLLALLSLCALPALGQDSNNLYCPVSGIPTWGAYDGPAQLPTICLNTSLANTPATGAVVNVTTAAQLASALAAAVCGQKITLQAGNVFSGHFTIPALACPSTNWLWIQSSAVASLPAEGARYSTSYTGSGGVVQTLYAPQFGPCYAGVTSQIGRPPLSCPGTPGTYTAQLITPNSSPVLTFLPNTTNIRFIGIEITRTPGTGTVSGLVNLGNQGTGISGIYWDRCWAHGDENEDETGRWFTSSGVSNVAVVDSYCNNIYFISVIGTGTDSKCIAGGANTVSSTPESGVKLVNNFIEASGENFIFGGAASNTVPLNFEIRLNLLFKPLQWNPDPGNPYYDGGVSGHPFIVKNLGEFKNGNYVLLEGNELVNVWGGFTQIGHALLVTPANQNGLCNVCFTGNITARYNLANTVGAAMELVTQAQNPYVAGNPLPAGGNHYSVHDWVIDNMNYATCYGCTDGSTITIYNDPMATPSEALGYVTVNHMTFVYATPQAVPTIAGAIGMGGALSSSPSVTYNIDFTNNVLRTWSGTIDPFARTTVSCSQPPVTSGTAMINACWVPNLFSGNCFVNNGSVNWPAGNITSVASYSELFTNYNAGDGGNYVLASSEACKGAATDGSDPGANIAMVASVIAGNPGATVAMAFPTAPVDVETQTLGSLTAFQVSATVSWSGGGVQPTTGD